MTCLGVNGGIRVAEVNGLSISSVGPMIIVGVVDDSIRVGGLRPFVLAGWDTVVTVWEFFFGWDDQVLPEDWSIVTRSRMLNPALTNRRKIKSHLWCTILEGLCHRFLGCSWQGLLLQCGFGSSFGFWVHYAQWWYSVPLLRTQHPYIHIDMSHMSEGIMGQNWAICEVTGLHSTIFTSLSTGISDVFRVLELMMTEYHVILCVKWSCSVLYSVRACFWNLTYWCCSCSCIIVVNCII